VSRIRFEPSTSRTQAKSVTSGPKCSDWSKWVPGVEVSRSPTKVFYKLSLNFPKPGHKGNLELHWSIVPNKKCQNIVSSGRRQLHACLCLSVRNTNRHTTFISVLKLNAYWYRTERGFRQRVCYIAWRGECMGFIPYPLCVVVSNGTWCCMPSGHVRSGTVQQYYPYPARRATQGLQRSGRKSGEGEWMCVSAEWIDHCLSARLFVLHGLNTKVT
jgi:hypothetical protein